MAAGISLIDVNASSIACSLSAGEFAFSSCSASSTGLNPDLVVASAGDRFGFRSFEHDFSALMMSASKSDGSSQALDIEFSLDDDTEPHGLTALHLRCMSKFGATSRFTDSWIAGDVDFASATGGKRHLSLVVVDAFGESSASSSSRMWRVNADVLNTKTALLVPTGPPVIHSDVDVAFKFKPMSCRIFVLEKWRRKNRLKNDSRDRCVDWTQA